MANCNFTDNSANYGGAIFIYSGNVSNCNFTRNTISNGDGGAVYMYSGNVTNCNFANNLAFNGEGGAGFFIWSNCNLMNCNFTNNSARYTGGAVYLNSGSFEYCNFVNNSAGNYGGAVYCYDTCNVVFCNFMGNYADYGSAFYFVIGASSKIFSNTCLLNNKAKVDEKSALQAIKNGTNIEITFSGHDNHLNAIYSNGKVICTNVTYWGACGINNTGSSPVISARSDKEAGQNITVKGIVNDRIINTTEVTDENGMVVLEDASDYWIIVSHDDDSYYTKAGETIFTNIELYVNVTSLTTSNRTVNLTAKSNIYNEVMSGKLLFILPDGTPINATYGTNGTWWTVHKFEDYDVYHVNASYAGLDNVTVNNGTVTITRANSTIILDDIVLNYGESINVTVTTEGATAITAKINENNLEVNNFTIPISDLGAGNYTLTVTTIPDENHVSANKTVKITVNKASVEIILTNETFDLKVDDTVSDFAHLIPANAFTLNYTSSNDEIVKVVNDEIITLKAGKANITVSFYGNENYTACEDKIIAVTVTLRDTCVIVENNTLDLKVDDTFNLNATAVPNILDIKYSSSNESVAIVNDDGIVTAVGEGATIITLTVCDDIRECPELSHFILPPFQV